MLSSVMAGFTSLQQPGYRLVDAGELQQMASLNFSVAGGIVGAAAPGPLLTAHINAVTGGGAASNVMLPPAIPGNYLFVVNTQTTATFTVIVNGNTFNPLTGAADLVAGAANATLAINSSAMFVCYTAGRWVQYNGIGAV